MGADGTSYVEQEMGWCIHFNGLTSERCKVGITYDSVKDTTVRPYGYPCIALLAGNTECPARQFPTREEAEAKEARIEQLVKAWVEDESKNVCPQCKQPMTKRQVGPCVYATPCGHRLYQGRA